MNKMIVANLAHRPIRTLISIFAVAIEVTLILLIVGLCLGMLNDSKARQAGIGADVVVMPPGSAYIVGLTGAPMPIKIRDVLAKLGARNRTEVAALIGPADGLPRRPGGPQDEGPPR